MNPMVTANQKPIIHTQTHTKERNKSLQLKKVIKHQGRNKTKEKERKKKERNYQNNQKTSSKMEVTTCLLVITLNVNGLNSLTKRHRVADWIKTKQSKTLQYTACNRVTSGLKTHRD